MNDNADTTWYVKLPSGDVHHVTVDQLDWAFEQGHIDANTLVLSEDATTWARLGEVAGLDEAPAAAPVTPAPAPAAVAAPAAALARAPVVPAAEPAPVVMVAPAPALPVAASPAPVSARPVPAPASYTPTPGPVSYAPSRAPVPNSLRPIAIDMDFDLNDAPFKARSRKGWVVAVLGLAVIGGGVGMASKLATGVGAAAPEAAAAQAPPPAETHIPYQTPSPTVAATPATGDSPLNPRFTQAQKDQLLKADKQHEEKKTHTAGAGRSSAKYKSTGFAASGNKYDPMASTL